MIDPGEWELRFAKKYLNRKFKVLDVVHSKGQKPMVEVDHQWTGSAVDVNGDPITKYNLLLYVDQVKVVDR